MSIFGGGNTGGASGGGGLFGSATNTNTNTGGGLFGASQNTASNTGGGGGLFGSSTNQTSNTGGGGGLFGSSTNTNNANNANQQSNTTGGGLFGSSTNQPTNTGGGGLFGSNTNQTNPSSGGGLFGSSTTQNANTGGGLFGSTNQNASNTQSTSLFGNPNPAPTTQATPSLFGNPTGNTNASNTSLFANGPSSLFGGTGGQNQATSQFGKAPQQQQQQQQALNASVFNPQTISVGNLGHTMTYTQLQRLQFSGTSTVPNEKSITKQIATVKDKWNPTVDPSKEDPSPSTILKTYLYNAVPKEYAPFFYPDRARGEDEKSWEEALSQKPELPKIDGQEITNQAYVPILCVGFKALGERAETQAKVIIEMRSRLHEMNNSLSAVMDAHQQRITVKIAAAKRQHQVLSQRCLRLAVKVQVLRNRGYALDAQEEGLRKTLMGLEKQVTDPGFVGREDEIWARLVQLRERARWLEEEGKRVAAQVNEQARSGAAAGKVSGVPEEILAKTRKILKDYDGQLQHLNKEMEEVKKEFAEWEETQQLRRR